MPINRSVRFMILLIFVFPMQKNEKKQMQNVQFQSVGELLDFLDPERLEMVETLRELVFETVPGVEERLSFRTCLFSGATARFVLSGLGRFPGAAPSGKGWNSGLTTATCSTTKPITWTGAKGNRYSPNVFSACRK